MRFASITIIWAALFSVATQGSEQIKVLAIADAQYAQKPARINRYYSDYIKKLERIEDLHSGENPGEVEFSGCGIAERPVDLPGIPDGNMPCFECFHLESRDFCLILHTFVL